LPVKIWIEPTNACNIKCKTCPQSLSHFPPRGMMSVDLMQKIVDELKVIQPTLVTLHMAGEPMMHNKIDKLVRMAKTTGAPVTISTNGLLLTQDKIDGLIEAGLDDMRIDFAADKSVYELIRCQSSWHTVYENIRILLETKKRRDTAKPILTLINIDVSPDNRQTLENLSRLRYLFDGYPFQTANLDIHTWAGEFAKEHTRNDPIFQVRTAESLVQAKYFPCIHLYGSFNISWNGDVLPCCRDLMKEYVIGNVADQSIVSLWNSDRLLALRRKHALKRHHEIPLCKNCDQVFRSHNLMNVVKKTMGRMFVH
ncbi:MAG: radical SAM protein, partial [Syntrophales bacterium]|nr:radical SAM protein [Syntrophales bacterium]